MTDAEDFDLTSANHLKAWREFRRMSQADLGAKAGTTGSVISLLESGDRKLSPKWLRKLADALNTTPGFLLDHHPDSIPTDVLDLWSAIPDNKRDAAIDMLRGLAKTGT